MLRINEVKLPLNHKEDALAAAIVSKLGIDAADLVGFSVFKRSYDARNKPNILLVYQVDAVLDEGLEHNLLASPPANSSIKPSPDTHYHTNDICQIYDGRITIFPGRFIRQMMIADDKNHFFTEGPLFSHVGPQFFMAQADGFIFGLIKAVPF